MAVDRGDGTYTTRSAYKRFSGSFSSPGAKTVRDTLSCSCGGIFLAQGPKPQSMSSDRLPTGASVTTSSGRIGLHRSKPEHAHGSIFRIRLPVFDTGRRHHLPLVPGDGVYAARQEFRPSRSTLRHRKHHGVPILGNRPGGACWRAGTKSRYMCRRRPTAERLRRPERAALRFMDRIPHRRSYSRGPRSSRRGRSCGRKVLIGSSMRFDIRG